MNNNYIFVYAGKIFVIDKDNQFFQFKRSNERSIEKFIEKYDEYITKLKKQGYKQFILIESKDPNNVYDVDLKEKFQEFLGDFDVYRNEVEYLFNFLKYKNITKNVKNLCFTNGNKKTSVNEISEVFHIYISDENIFWENIKNDVSVKNNSIIKNSENELEKLSELIEKIIEGKK